MRDFRPCLKNGVAGLYDDVSKRIFYSLGTPLIYETKKAAPKKKDIAFVEYIESPSAACEGFGGKGCVGQRLLCREGQGCRGTPAYGNPSEAYRELEKQKSRLGDSPITLLVNCNDDKQAAARRDGKLPPNVKFGRDRDHLRACAFLGIVKGGNGLFWWWFAKDSKWYYSASQCPDAWRDLSAVVHEVAALRSAVASAESVVTGECGAPDARVLWWGGLVGGKRIIIMVNTSDRPVSVPSILCQVPLTLGRYEVKIIRE